MAKDNYRPIDFSGANTPDWAAARRKAYLLQQDEEANNLSAANALASQMRAQGASESAIDAAVLQLMNGQQVDTKDQPQTLPVLPSAAPKEEQGFLGSLVDQIQGGGQQAAASLLTTAANRPSLGYDIASAILPEQAANIRQTYGDVGKSLQAAAQANRSAAQPEYERLGSRNWLIKHLGQGALDAAASPTSAASLIGGPFGSVSIIDAYDQAYAQAVDAGIDDPTDREMWAVSQAAPELISFIPAGKVLERLPVVGTAVNRLLKRPVQNLAAQYIERMGSPALKAAMRTVNHAVGEGLEEGITQAAQDASAGGFANFGEGGLQELGKQTASTTLGGNEGNGTFWEGIGRAFRAGSVTGGVLPLPHNVHQAISEDRANSSAWQEQFSKDVANNLENVIPHTADETTQRALEVRNQNESINRELYNASEDVRQDEAKVAARDTAFSQAEAEAAQRKADEEEAGFRTLERQRITPLDSRFGALADLPVTPEQVAAERPAPEVVAEAAPVVEQITEQEAATPAPVAKKAVKRAAPKVASKPAATAQETAKPSGLDIARLLSSKNAEDRKLAKAAQDLGLGQASEGITVPEDADVETTRQFAGKVQSLGKALAGNRKAANQIGRLVNQGKLVIAPNAQSIGRNDYSRSAEYDTGDGKMYVYTDHLSDNPVQDLLVAAPHEGTHAGTFNPRNVGRGQVMDELMGDETVIKAAGKLRSAANSGNKLAQSALRQAEADTLARTERGEKNPNRHEDKELVAYFVGEAQKARQGTLGSAGGAMRDMVAGARSVLRDRLGVDLDVSVNDLTSAANSVLDEIAKTDTRGKKSNDSLGIIYPKSAKGYEKALKDGRVYTSSQGNEQFVLSDADAEMKPDAEKAMRKLRKGESVNLEDILDHPTLYDNVPEARNIKIVADAQSDDAGAAYFPGSNTISVSRDLLNGNAPFSVRNAILHETQHWVQDKSEAREGFFTESPKTRPEVERKAVKRFEEATRANDRVSREILDGAKFFADSLPTAGERRAAMQTVLDRNLTDAEKARDLVGLVESAGNVDEDVQPLLDKFNDSLQEYRDAAKGFNAAQRMRRARYLSNPTEAEAFFTQANSRTPQEDLPVNPEEDENFGTEAMASRGNDSTSESLGMAAPKEDTSTRQFRNMPGGTLLTSLLRNDKGLGKDVLRALENASSNVAVYESLFNNYAGQFDKELQNLADKRGTTVEELNKEIEKGMDEISGMDGTPSEYKAAFTKLANKYGDAGQWLQKLRDLNDELSMGMVNAYLEKGGKLTPNEVKQLQSVINNMGRYVHRFYAARQPGDLGKIYQDSVLEAVERAKKGKNLNATQKDLLNKWQAASRVILGQTYIPDDAALNKMSSDRVDYLYRTWFGNVDGGESKEQKVAALSERRAEVTPEELQNKVEQSLTDLVRGIEATAATQRWGGSQRDNTILQKRTDIPKELRQLMGEVKDPGTALMVTAAKQAEFVTKTRMFLELKSAADPNDLQPPTAGGSKRVLDNNMKPLEGEQYGPLKGWYASPAMRSMIEDTQTSLAGIGEALANGDYDAAAQSLASKGVNLWMKGASVKKALDIVGNLYRYILNVAGSPAMLINNGVFNPASWARGGKDALNLIRYAASPRSGLGSAEDAVKYNVVDSATVGDLKTLDRGKLENLIRDMSGKGHGSFMKAAKKAGLAARETYAMADVWAKIASFHDETKHLTNLYKAAGIPKTAEEIKAEAADTANRTNISYSHALPIVKALERGGISRYGPYMYEVIRSQMANAGQGVYELYRSMQMPNAASKALAFQRGVRRLGGQAAVWSAFGLASKMLGDSVWGDDEDKKRQAGLYEGSENSDYIPVGKTAGGKELLFRFSDVDPIGPATDIMRAARAGDEGAFDRALSQFKELYIEPALGVQAYEALFDPNKAGRKDPLIKDLAPRAFEEVLNVTGNENRVKALINLAEGFLPGTVRAWGSNNPFATQPMSDSGVDQATAGLYNTLNLLGARAVKLDPAGRIGSAGWDYSDKVKDLRTDYAAYLAEHPNATPEQMLERATSYAMQERDEWKKLQTLRDGAISLGYSPESVDAVMKKSKVPVSVISQLNSGQFAPRLINKASVQSAAEKSMKGKSQKEKEQLAARWEKVWEIIAPYAGE